MEPDGSKLRELVERVGGFHLRGSVERAQRRMTELLSSGAALQPEQVASYLRETQHYFAGFEREARTHMKNLDRRLAHVSQLQFNLTAERGVALRRVEITQGVLRALAELGDE
jgi:uncharacterized protein YoaH (UPF0181 family)